MAQYKPYRRQRFRSSIGQSVRLLSNYEKPQACTARGCPKPATGEDEGKVYCAGHFVVAVRRHWGT